MVLIRTIILPLLLGLTGGVAGMLIASRFISPHPALTPEALLKTATVGRIQTGGLLEVEEARKHLVALYPVGQDGTLLAKPDSLAVALTADGLIGAAQPLKDVSKFRAVTFNRRVFTLTPALDAKGNPFRSAELGVRFYMLSGAVRPELSPASARAFEDIRLGELLFTPLTGGTLSVHRVVGSDALSRVEGVESSEELVATFTVDGNPPVGAWLFDQAGKLIGVAQKNGRVFPAEFLESVLRQYLDKQSWQATSLGVHFRDLNKAPPAPKYPAFGLLLSSAPGYPAVRPGSPAAAAGLQSGDILVAFDRHRLDGSTPLQILLQRYRAGVEVEVGVLRDEKEQVFKVTLGGK